MPEKIIEIPNVGRVAFPDTMSEDDINTAAGKLYAEKNTDHPKPDPSHSWVDTAVDWLPAAGGMVGGIAGGVAGAPAGGVGAIPGAVGGAAVGGAAGEAGKQMINRWRGAQAPSGNAAALDMVKQAGIQGGAELVGGAVGRVMKPAGEMLMQTALKPGYRAALKSVRAGQTPAVVKTLLDEGVNVTAGGVRKLNAIIDASNQEIKAAVASIPFEVNPFKVASRLGKSAANAATQVNPEADLAIVSDVGQEFLRNNPRMIPGVAAQEMKTGTYRQLGNKSFGEVKSTAIEAQKDLARGLKEEIEKEFAAAGGGTKLAEVNAREGRAIDAMGEVARRVAVGGNNNPMGIASLVTSMPKTFLLALIDRSPVVKSMIARGLYSSAGAAARVNPQLIRAAVAAIASSSDDETPTAAGTEP